MVADDKPVCNKPVTSETLSATAAAFAFLNAAAANL